jgi:hypothetical protein
MESVLDKAGSFYIFLNTINFDDDEDSLTIEVTEAHVQDDFYVADKSVTDHVDLAIEKLKESSKPIVVNDDSRKFRITFAWAAFYLVSEEFDYDQNREICDDGGVIGLVSESPLMTHLKADTTIYENNVNLKMFVIATSSMWIRVISDENPIVEQIIVT